MNYKFRRYSSSYLPSLTKLLHTSFSIKNNDKEALIIWKYFHQYHNNETTTYIALHNNIVVSHYTNLPTSIIYGNKIYKSMICTDMCTDIFHRGKGLISELSKRVYREVTKHNYALSIGFSNDQGVKVDQFASNYGYIIVGKFVRYFKFVLYRKNISYQLIKTTEFGKYDNLNSKYFKLKKDHDYLSWRYVKKPNSEYDIYNIVSDNKTIGYVILRFLEYKCYVYDIITETDNKKHMITVLRSIENKALDHGIRVIIYNVLDNFYWETLFNRYKYFKHVSNTINYYLTIKLHDNSIAKKVVLNKENWILMNGDIL